MADGGANSLDSEDRLAESRRQFVTSLGERMQVLSAALESLSAAPGDRILRGSFQRRVHALGVACAALGFADAQSAVARIETLLGAVADPDREGQLEKIARLLDMIPAMVLGGEAPLSVPPPADAPAPISAIFYGLGSLASGFQAKGFSWEVRSVSTPETAAQAMREAAADVLIVDAGVPHAQQVVEQGLNDPSHEALRVVVVGAFERPEAAAAYLHAGVHRVLPKPISPASLERHVRELCQTGPRSLQVAPLGELTLDELVNRVQQELRRGLLDSARPGAREASIPFGEGVEELAAVWGAVARIRELAALRSGGSVSFESGGPEGAIALAPWGAGERYASASAPRSEAAVSLKGRRVIVADDDPAVVWFIGGVLREAGAEVLEAADGQAALQLAYQHWPDLIVSDLLMPRLDGFELCRRIKRDLLLSDVPVVVLSWKEDLLQRVRELGADADGYLQKEANGSVIARSVREVLHARSRIEERFRKSPEVRGRLDSITPRLVLDLAGKLLGNASISLRDAAYLYEIELRSGRIVSVQRTDTEGRSQHAAGLIGPLLGVRVGRFSVRRSSKTVDAVVDASLHELSRDAAARSRAAQNLLSAPNLANVGRVQVAENRVAPYLALSPAKARTVAQELLAGRSPSEVGEMYGERLLDSLLQDLVLHDGVEEIFDRDGEGMLTQAVGAAPELPPMESPKPPRVLPGSRAAGVGLASKAPAKGASLAPALHSAASLPAGLARPSGVAIAHQEQSSRVPRPARPSLTAKAPPRPTSLSPSPPAVTVEDSRASERDSEPGLELGEALIEQLLDEEVQPVAASEPPPALEERDASASDAMRSSEPEIELRADSSDEPIELTARKSSPEAVAVRGVIGVAGAAASVSGDSGSLHEPVRSPKSVGRPAYGAGLPLDESPVDAVLQSLTADESDASAQPEVRPVLRPGQQAVFAVEPTPAETAPPEGDREPSAAPLAALLIGDAEVDAVLRPVESTSAPASVSPEPPAPAVRELTPLPSVELDAESQVHEPVRSEPPRRGQPRSPEPTLIADPPRAPWGGVLLGVLAAVGAFSLMWKLTHSEDAPPPRPQARSSDVASQPVANVAGPEPAAPASAAAVVVAAEVAGSERLISSDRALPPEIAITPGKGLLEVDTANKHRIYVDGVFVGPGPLRRIPLSPGSHEVRISLDGVELQGSVQLRDGRRTLVQRAGSSQK